MQDEDEAYQPGANWSSKDGKRNIVIVEDVTSYRGRAFLIRNLTTGRQNSIEMTGLVNKFRYTGFDPAFTAGTQEGSA